MLEAAGVYGGCNDLRNLSKNSLLVMDPVHLCDMENSILSGG